MPAKKRPGLPDLDNRILLVRSARVLLDSDLAQLYGVTTSRLNEQVKRNLSRFPEDFAFRLEPSEIRNMMSQIAISSSWGGRRTPPYVFTEHGAVMLASVLNTPTAVQASLYVVRAFIRLRQLLGAHARLVRRIDELEDRYDGQFHAVFEAIRQLMSDEPPDSAGKIGFHKA